MPGTKIGNSVRIKGPTTNRVRRHDAETQEWEGGHFEPTGIVAAAPALPTRPPRSLGDYSSASPGEVAAAAAANFTKHPANAAIVRRGMGELLGHLTQFSGSTWQERWEAAGHDEPGSPVTALAEPGSREYNRLNVAAGHAFAMRLIRPSLRAFRSYTFTRYAPWFRLVAQDPLLDRFCDAADQLPLTSSRRTRTKFDVCAALTVFGIDLADLTPEAFLYYADQSRRFGLAGEEIGSGSFAGVQAWPLLIDAGVFPAATPRTLRAAVTRGQRSVEQLVDEYELTNRQVRDLLVDYIRRRAVELDYSTSRSLARHLAKTFWKTVEEIHPGQQDLRLSEEVFLEWKERLQTLPNGTTRLDLDGPLLAIRALYLDLHTWAVAEPERWAHWVAPCPITDADLRWSHLRRRRLQERMAKRTRDRQPLLATLSEHVTSEWLRLSGLLAAAQTVGLGEEFSFAGETWLHTSSRDHERHNRPPVWAINRATGELIKASALEPGAFWRWAIIETLRLAGLRAEELTELTHLSIRQYQRPNSEVVALLVISPSKSDRERVIPMSAELFHVIAQVVRRHRDEHGTVPVCIRYDPHEKEWSEEMPYLFQAVHGGAQRAMSTTTVWRRIREACKELAVDHPEFAEVKFAPHDFRRLFATELVNNGLPIHIGAALLGHLDIRTTRGYVAVFDEEVIKHYQKYLAQRRAERPAEEYREPTKEEWADFTEHFDKRRVELGSCGRPYGTGCQHEHACLRCPMLSINPKMLPRLDEIEEDLQTRRRRAVAEDWKGEIEGIDLTLTFLRGKRAEARRIAQMAPVGTVDLGLPAPPPRK